MRVSLLPRLDGEDIKRSNRVEVGRQRSVGGGEVVSGGVVNGG